MKNRKSELSLIVTAALIGISSTGLAQQNSTSLFTPIEQLDPQSRSILVEKIQQIEKVVKIDWQTIVIGIDENGDLILKERKIINRGPVANPSCWAD